MTDDQDAHLGSMDFMPLVHKYIMEQGTTYKNHFCTVALCCPSRVSFLTGQAAHNTNVTHVFAPYAPPGGYPKFISQGYNHNYLPVWLQEVGYNTYYVGKLMNGHTVENWNDPLPAGWNGTEFLVDPNTYNYLNATFQRNSEPPESFPGRYSTDLVAERALGFLDDAIEASTPFFIGVAPVGPHAQAIGGDDARQSFPPIPAPRHEHLFPNLTVPRTYNFNPDSPSLAAWAKSLEKLNETEVEYGDYYHRRRIQTLQAVDELVESIILRLEQSNLLENTFVIFTTDNGFHISQHRLLPGKSCAIVEDIHIPFIIRGPGVLKRNIVDLVTTHTDLAPTFLKMAGADMRENFDGQAIPFTARELVAASRDNHPEHVNVEYWGNSPGGQGTTSLPNGTTGNFSLSNRLMRTHAHQATLSVSRGSNTYKAMRIIGENYSVFYSVWCTNEREIYDMLNDPGQMHNLFDQKSTHLLHRPMHVVQDRLDALLMVLKSCKTKTCQDPWGYLHPDKKVRTLSDALQPKYDQFYAEQPKITFQQCGFAYVPEAEGMQEALVWDP
ncbi:sulfatase [Penicillium longicatenatum]|nr:sulfatase [Penicillium longicatenatum]